MSMSRFALTNNSIAVGPVNPARTMEPTGPEPALEDMLERALGGVGATGAFVALRTKDGVYCQASTGFPAPEVGTRLLDGSGLTGLCLSTGEIQLCNDPIADPRVDSRLWKSAGIGSVLAFPIRQNARVVGVLEVLSSKPDAFNETHTFEVKKLADRILLVATGSLILQKCGCVVTSPGTSEDRPDLEGLLAAAYVLQEHHSRTTTELEDPSVSTVRREQSTANCLRSELFEATKNPFAVLLGTFTRRKGMVMGTLAILATLLLLVWFLLSDHRRVVGHLLLSGGETICGSLLSTGVALSRISSVTSDGIESAFSRRVSAKRAEFPGLRTI
jgi:hypothetical protein